MSSAAELIHVLDPSQEPTLPLGPESYEGKFTAHSFGGLAIRIVVSTGVEYDRSNGAKAELLHADMYHLALHKTDSDQGIFDQLHEEHPEIGAIDDVDYGRVVYDASAVPPTLTFKGKSIDFGRGSETNRRDVCDAAQLILGDSVRVVNGDSRD